MCDEIRSTLDLALADAIRQGRVLCDNEAAMTEPARSILSVNGQSQIRLHTRGPRSSEEIPPSKLQIVAGDLLERQASTVGSDEHMRTILECKGCPEPEKPGRPIANRRTYIKRVQSGTGRSHPRETWPSTGVAGTRCRWYGCASVAGEGPAITTLPPQRVRAEHHARPVAARMPEGKEQQTRSYSRLPAKGLL